MALIATYFAEAQTATITIDGITYRVPLLDADSRQYVTSRAVGASEVKSVRGATVDDSTTRVTLVAPASGKAIRVIAASALNLSGTVCQVEIYFGAGASITTTAGKEVVDIALKADVVPIWSMCWPDGAGPVGAADDVLSLRTSANITTNVVVLVHYREE